MSIQEDNILTRALEKKISRRSFVKWSAALGATASMSGLVMQTGAKMAVGQVNVPASAATALGGSIVDWKPSCCLVCHSWCHIACGIDGNGHVRKIEGAGGQPKKYGSGGNVKNLTCDAPNGETTLSADAALGATTVSLTSVADVRNGQQITIDGTLTSPTKLTAAYTATGLTLTVADGLTGYYVDQRIKVGSDEAVVAGTAATTITLVAPGLATNHAINDEVNGVAKTVTINDGGNPVTNPVTLSAALTGKFLSGSKVTGVNWSGTNVVVAASGLQSKPDDANHIATGEGYLAYAPHNKGRICAKGNDGVEHLYDPDRIKYPLKRVGNRGSGKWTRITWDEALTEIANVLRELAGVLTNVDGSPNGGRGQDLRHRFVQFVGRNENAVPKNFSKAYGTPNHIEHTSLCELGRHVAGRTMWGHHWSSVDMQVHANPSGGTPWPTTAQNGPGGTLPLDPNQHDIDCYIEWGGNPCEAKIPHSAWATHLGDRRRRNLEGYTGPARYGRIMTIDVRQSNTAAFSDEYFQLVPGTDGALALGLIRHVMETVGPTALRQQLEKGHMGGTGGKTDGDSGYDASKRLYYGLFKEEEGGIASGSGTTTVPSGKSLESYLYEAGAGGFANHITAASSSLADIKARVCAMSGLLPSEFDYLGALFVNGNGKFLNVVTDTYRGPVKHTNGVYNTRAIRALQILAPNYSAAQFGAAMYGGGYVAPAVSRGGYNAPGAFISDKNWNPYNYGGGVAGTGGVPAYINKVLDGTASNGAVGPNGVPADQGMKLAGDNTSNRQRIDDWDYDLGVPRYRGAYKWVDQNLSPGIRHSVGMHAFEIGSPATAVKGPYYYKDWRNKNLGTYDTTFKVEAMLNHKNAPGYARPQQNNEVDLLSRKNPATGEYYLKNFWSIDIAMGDGTRFADIILPDASYLERYAERSGEGQEFNYRDNMFWRLPVYEVNGPTIGTNVVPRHIYDIRQVRAIYYELARKIEPGNTPTYGATGPWSGSLYNTFKWVTGDLGSVAQNAAGAGTSAINDGEYANKKLFEQACNTAALNNAASVAGATDGADYIRSHGMLWNTKDRPAYWRVDSYRGDGETSGSGDTYAPGAGFKPNLTTSVGHMLTVYNNRLATTPDIVINNADDGTGTKLVTYATDGSGNFYGGPVYVAPIQVVSGSYPLHLTTYKVNVQTQSRTACLPRLAEILGDSWAVIHPDTANGVNPVNATLAANPIKNGDTILVTSETGGIEGVAKVSEKAQRGCVHISHSFGHRKGVFKINDDEGNPNRAAFGTYLVSESGGPYTSNRYQSETLNNPSGSPCDGWAKALPPSAPGKGTHANIVITHHLSGAATQGRNIATDAIGGDQAWFETKVKIEKL